MCGLCICGCRVMYLKVFEMMMLVVGLVVDDVEVMRRDVGVML